MATSDDARRIAMALPETTETITDAWLVTAPTAARKAWLAEHGLR